MCVCVHLVNLLYLRFSESHAKGTRQLMSERSLQLTRDTRLEASPTAFCLQLCVPRPPSHTHIHSARSVRGMSLAFIQFMICIRSLSVAFRNYNTQSIWKYAALDDHNVAYYADDPAPTPTPTVPQPTPTHSSTFHPTSSHKDYTAGRQSASCSSHTSSLLVVNTQDIIDNC